jgi:myo-inositol-1(or 4)-monophosphatase
MNGHTREAEMSNTETTKTWARLETAAVLGQNLADVEMILLEMSESAKQEWHMTTPHMRAIDGGTAIRVKDDDGLKSLVTDVDGDCEEAAMEMLALFRKRDGVVGEEGTVKHGTSGIRWFIDPLDGTSAFCEGLPHWGHVLCAVDAAGPLYGGAYFPRLDTVYLVERGGGVYFNCFADSSLIDEADRLHPLDVDASIGPLDTVLIGSKTHQRWRLMGDFKARNLGSVAAHLFIVARGGAKAAFICENWKTWDVAAGILAIQELGGLVVSLDGRNIDPVKDVGVPFVAGGRMAVLDLHAALVPHTEGAHV